MHRHEVHGTLRQIAVWATYEDCSFFTSLLITFAEVSRECCSTRAFRSNLDVPSGSQFCTTRTHSVFPGEKDITVNRDSSDATFKAINISFKLEFRPPHFLPPRHYPFSASQRKGRGQWHANEIATAPLRRFLAAVVPNPVGYSLSFPPASSRPRRNVQGRFTLQCQQVNSHLGLVDSVKVVLAAAHCACRATL